MLRRVGWLAFVLLLSSCGRSYYPAQWQRPDTVLVASDVILEAEDGAFRLAPGEAAQTPFWSADCPGTADEENVALGLRLGGRRVRVTSLDGRTTVRGVLSLCQVHHSVAGSRSRRYTIRVPAAELEVARSRPTAVSEPQGFEVDYENGRVDVPAWILWLQPEGG